MCKTKGNLNFFLTEHHQIEKCKIITKLSLFKFVRNKQIQKFETMEDKNVTDLSFKQRDT